MNGNSFVRKRRQFLNLSKHINLLLRNRKWDNLSTSVKAKLIARLNSLFQAISRYFSVSSIKKVLAAAAVFIALPLISRSQTFDPPVANPFGYIPPNSTMGSPAFADLDKDGDMDLLVGDYGGNILFYENTGTKTSPAFAAAKQNPFGLSILPDYPFLAVTDIDNDGDIDLFVGGYSGNIHFFKNNGTPQVPAFAASIENPFNITNIGLFSFPTFADIDHDGDLDLFVSGLYGKMQYFKNTGTASLANFASPVENPFGITPVNIFGAPIFADLDHDGDMDLLEGEYYGNTRYFKNTGTATEPAFASPLTNPFGITQVSYYAIPALADLDNDGDLDLILGEYYGHLQYFKNTETHLSIPDIDVAGAFELYPNPATDKVLLTMKGNNPTQRCKIQITDAQGKILQERNENKQASELDIDQYAPGVYYVRLVSDRKTTTRRLIIK